jgi:hypothetical protein
MIQSRVRGVSLSLIGAFEVVAASVTRRRSKFCIFFGCSAPNFLDLASNCYNSPSASLRPSSRHSQQAGECIGQFRVYHAQYLMRIVYFAYQSETKTTSNHRTCSAIWQENLYPDVVDRESKGNFRVIQLWGRCV